MFQRRDKVKLLSWRDQSFMYDGKILKVYKASVKKDGDKMYNDMQKLSDDDQMWTMDKHYNGGYNVYYVKLDCGRKVFWDESAMSS